jgi:hypothetical protein
VKATVEEEKPPVADNLPGPQVTFPGSPRGAAARAPEAWDLATLPASLRHLCADHGLTDDDIRAALDAMRELDVADHLAELLKRAEGGDTAAQDVAVTMVMQYAAMARQREPEARVTVPRPVPEG